MSERRQLALLLAGLVTLTLVGVVGATVFPEPCEGLEQVGELDLRFTDAVDSLPVAVDDGTSLEELGEDLGIGPWRGAVALPEDADVSRSEFGFFVTTAEDFVVLRPSMGIASAARGRAGLDVIPAGTSLALRAADGETGVVNSEYEMDRCGELPADLEVLAIDRGFAVVVDGGEVALVTLSGDEVWRAPAATAAHVHEEVVVLGRGDELELRSVRTGDVVATTAAGVGAPWLSAVGDLVLRSGAGVDRVGLLAEGFVEQDAVAIDEAAEVAVGTPAGVVAVLDDGRVVTDRTAAGVALPAGVTALELHASEDGHVGLIVEVEGSRALLVYGPDRTD